MLDDSILDHPDFQALGDLERAEAAQALVDPEARSLLLLRNVMALRNEAKLARTYCHVTCAPSFSRRLGVLERWRWMLIGGGVIALACWEWAKDRILP